MKIYAFPRIRLGKAEMINSNSNQLKIHSKRNFANSHRQRTANTAEIGRLPNMESKIDRS